MRCEQQSKMPLQCESTLAGNLLVNVKSIINASIKLPFKYMLYSKKQRDIAYKKVFAGGKKQ